MRKFLFALNMLLISFVVFPKSDVAPNNDCSLATVAMADIAPPPPDETTKPTQPASTQEETKPQQKAAEPKAAGCSLIQSAHANVPPPPKPCADKKEGDACKEWDDRHGTCVDVCKGKTDGGCIYNGKPVVSLKCETPKLADPVPAPNTK